MNLYSFIPGVICISIALLIMFLLMRYAHFYAPSYFFWIGAILALIGIISLIQPLFFLFIINRTIAVCVICGGILISLSSLFSPVKLYHSQTNLEIDTLLPDYYFNEYHEVVINTPVEKIKQVLRTTSVSDIPVIHFLMKIRGIAGDKNMSDKVTNNQQNPDSFSTPDFNFIVANPSEFFTMMIIRASAKTPPPEITTAEQFRTFNESGYVKVAINFRFISLSNGQTLLSTETRNLPITKKDCRIFGSYWRIIYPGSAIIRRAWLNTLARKAEKNL